MINCCPALILSGSSAEHDLPVDLADTAVTPTASPLYRATSPMLSRTEGSPGGIGQHLLKHASHLPALRKTGCAFVTTAVESVDDDVLRILDKGHTCA
jgi:hypothetical protein